MKEKDSIHDDDTTKVTRIMEVGYIKDTYKGDWVCTWISPAPDEAPVIDEKTEGAEAPPAMP